MKNRSINIFDSSAESEPSKRGRKKSKSKAERQRLADKEELGKRKLEKLNPMVIPLLASKKDPPDLLLPLLTLFKIGQSDFQITGLIN